MVRRTPIQISGTRPGPQGGMPKFQGSPNPETAGRVAHFSVEFQGQRRFIKRKNPVFIGQGPFQKLLFPETGYFPAGGVPVEPGRNPGIQGLDRPGTAARFGPLQAGGLQGHPEIQGGVLFPRPQDRVPVTGQPSISFWTGPEVKRLIKRRRGNCLKRTEPPGAAPRAGSKTRAP